MASFLLCNPRCNIQFDNHFTSSHDYLTGWLMEGRPVTFFCVFHLRPGLRPLTMYLTLS